MSTAFTNSVLLTKSVLCILDNNVYSLIWGYSTQYIFMSSSLLIAIQITSYLYFIDFYIT